MDSLKLWERLRQPVLQDVGLAALLLAGTLVLNNAGFMLRKIHGILPGGPWPVDLYVWWIATGVCVVAVLFRRRWPIAVLTVAMLGAMTQLALGAGPVAADLAVPIALYTIAMTHGRKTSLAILVGCLLVVAGWLLYLDPAERATAPPKPQGLRVESSQEGPAPGEIAASTGWGGFPVIGSVLVAGWAIGWSAQKRRAYREHEREQRDALAAAAERTRITRELHDVVAHGLAAMVMQAQGGTAMLDKRPADTRTALATIIETGRASLTEMRQVLAAVGGVDPSHSPMPGLGRLPELVGQVRRSGTPVTTRIEGSPRTLPATVDLSAYRIIQEALTNTMKHAGPGAAAEVVVTFDRRVLRLEITDDGSARRAPDGLGNGLRGMRERVGLLDGELHTEHGPHGFVVRARIPYGGAGPA